MRSKKDSFSSRLINNIQKLILLQLVFIGIAMSLYSYFSFSSELKATERLILGQLMTSLTKMLNYGEILYVQPLLESTVKASDDRFKVYVTLKKASNTDLFAFSGDSSVLGDTFKTQVVTTQFAPYFGEVQVGLTLGYGDQVIKSLLLLFLIILICGGLSYLLFWYIKKDVSLQSFSVDELESVMKSIETNMNQSDVLKKAKSLILEYSDNKAKTSTLESLAIQAQQVAHDIRSPLSALNIMIPSMNALPEENRVIIRQAIQRINDIANELLHKKNKNTASALENANVTTSIFLVAPVVDAIISEKRIQFRDKINVQIEVDLADSYGLFIDFNLAELKRIISNLINNSVEALPNNAGKIEIKVLNKEKTILIQIKDNGKGIPAHILKTLGQRGVSHGKEGTASGSGLGLYHAKTTIEQLGGSFELLSEVGIGTQINISISPASNPHWYIKKLTVSEKTLVVSVDDDVSIHGLWRNRLSGLQKSAQLAAPIDFLSFTSTTEFSEWYKTQEPVKINSCVFLIDFEFINQKINGLDLIENLNLKATLVTSRYDDVNIQERCHKLNVKLIPKSMAGLVPIVIEKPKIKYDWVLIDDDTLIQQTWAILARERKVKFIGFLNYDEFKLNKDSFDTESTIYLDSVLGVDSSGNKIQGENLAEEIFSFGFQRIYITTGHDPEFIQANKYIKGVLGKNPPNIV